MMLFNLIFTIFCGLHLTAAIDVRYDGLPDGNPQQWGYVDVREGAHMFWWMHFVKSEAVTDFTERPLVFWLQGGPGSSSTGYGNFEILGPLDLDLKERNFTWIYTHNVLFVDNPVGTGYSYVDDNRYLTTDNKQIAIDLVSLLKGVYEKLPEFETVPLHIFGESYGGKMAIEFAYELNKAIANGEIRANLQGAYLGDAWISPIESTLSWAPYLFQLSFVDEDGFQKIDNMARRTERVLSQGQYVKATDLWYLTEIVLIQETHDIDFYNVLYNIEFKEPIAETKADVKSFRKQNGEFLSPRDIAYEVLVNYRSSFKELTSETVANDEEPMTLNKMMREIVHPKLGLPANVRFGSQSGDVFDTLAGDFMKPVVEMVEKVLNETSVKVNVYSGQLDLICSTPGTISWVNRMNWSGKKQYASAPRDGIGINGILEGYVRKFGNFGMYWLNRAGHMAPRDNPRVTSSMLKRETNFASEF